MAFSTSATAPWTIFLDCENAECSLPSVSRRDVGRPHRPRPVLVRLEAGVERLEIGLQVALVVRHRYPIHAGRCLPPQPSERSFERLAREVVEQRREPGLARPDGRVVHPNETGVPGAPALCLDRLRPARATLWLEPSLRPARVLRRHQRYYAPIRHPADPGARPLVSLGAVPLR